MAEVLARIFPELAGQLLRPPPAPPNVDERRGIVRPWEDQGGSVSALTRSLMNRQRLECITWREVWEDFVSGDMFLRDKYTFEQLRTYWVSPEESLEAAISRHAKVALHPDRVYRITERVQIRGSCYVIGNGATVMVDTSERVGFLLTMQQMGPAIVGMFGCTFMNVKFTCETTRFRGKCIMANTYVTVHGCQFAGFPGDCLELHAGGRVRGTVFSAVFKAIVSTSRNALSVSKCIFDKCMLGISSVGYLKARDNVSVECLCFLLCKGLGRITHNVIQGPFLTSYRLVTCANGGVTVLRTVHVAAHPRRTWPVFEHNVMFRTNMFLGHRRGIFLPRQCNLVYCNVVLDRDAASSVGLSGVWDMNVNVYKVLRVEERRNRLYHCECGETHLATGHILGLCTEEVRTDHLQNTVARAEFSSSEDEQD